MADHKLNGLEKAAVLLHSLPAPVVEKVLTHMDARQASLVRAELAKVSARGDLTHMLTAVLSEAADVMAAPAKTTAPKPGAPPREVKPKPTLDLRIVSDEDIE